MNPNQDPIEYWNAISRRDQFEVMKANNEALKAENEALMKENEDIMRKVGEAHEALRGAMKEPCNPQVVIGSINGPLQDFVDEMSSSERCSGGQQTIMELAVLEICRRFIEQDKKLGS